jgi:hypothetical protein
VVGLGFANAQPSQATVRASNEGHAPVQPARSLVDDDDGPHLVGIVVAAVLTPMAVPAGEAFLPPVNVGGHGALFAVASPKVGRRCDARKRPKPATTPHESGACSRHMSLNAPQPYESERIRKPQVSGSIPDVGSMFHLSFSLFSADKIGPSNGFSNGSSGARSVLGGTSSR